MSKKHMSFGNHIPGNDNDGYMYSFNTSEGVNYNSHIHKCFEFIHVIRGSLLYTVEGSEYTLSDGDFIMTAPDELHSFSFPKSGEYRREFLHVYPGFLSGLPALLDILGSRRHGYFNMIPRSLVEAYGINEIFSKIKQCGINKCLETDIFVLAHTTELIGKIAQVMREQSPVEGRIALNRTAAAARDFIDHHYYENISLEDIASALFVSASYLSRTFKNELGMTVKTYIDLRRVTRAKNLMQSGSKATDIFSECGFSDYSTFYRTFTRLVGMTPGEYKHMQKDTGKIEL